MAVSSDVRMRKPCLQMLLFSRGFKHMAAIERYVALNLENFHPIILLFYTPKPLSIYTNYNQVYFRNNLKRYSINFLNTFSWKFKKDADSVKFKSRNLKGIIVSVNN